jgi:PilZ domain
MTVSDRFAMIVQVEMSLQSRMKAIASVRSAAPIVREDAPPCNRRSRRKALAIPGLLTFPNMRLAVPCTVTDMSGDGARVIVTPSEDTKRDVNDLPKRLTLVMRLDHLYVDCTVVWRREGKIGLRFLGSPQPMPRATR